MILFLMGYLAILIVIIIGQQIFTTQKHKELMTLTVTFIGFSIMFGFNSAITTKIFLLNEDLPEVQQDAPAESNFLLLIYYVVAFLVILSQVILNVLATGCACFTVCLIMALR